MRTCTIAAVVITLFFGSVVPPAHGAPVPQAWKDGASISPSLTTFGIYAETSDTQGFGLMAAKLSQWLPHPPNTLWLVRDLSEIGTHPGENQIVLGNPAVSPRVATLAAQHNLTTLDLGTEGYMLDSRLPPDATCDWRVLIVANDPAGARFAIATLLEKLIGGEWFAEVRIRDYPDRTQRGFFYSFGPVGQLQKSDPPSAYDVPAWMEARKADIDNMAMRGINTLYIAATDWFRLRDDVVAGNPGNYSDPRRGARIAELFDYCKKLRIDPAPNLGINDPPINWDGAYAKFREGKLIDGELFNAAPGETLTNVLGNFDNHAENLDWSCADPGTGLPCQWSQLNGPGWTWDQAGHRLSITNHTGDARVVTRVPIVPGSFYVLRVALSRIEFSTEGCPPGANCIPNVHVRGTNTGGGNGWIAYCYLRTPFPGGGQDSVVYECAFLAPASAIPDNFVDLQISTNGGTNVSLAVNTVTIDRRDAGFLNLMRDPPTTFNGESFPGLPLVVTSEDNSIIYEEGEGRDYTVESTTPWRTLDHRMPWNGPISRIRWDPNCAPPPSGRVRVRSTLGVPPLRDNSNATTWCFGHGSLYAAYDAVFQDIFEEFDMDPRFIHIDLDEMRGMNRCGRCRPAVGVAGRGLSNCDYLIDHVNRMQARINAHAGGAQTRAVVFSDMLSPYHNGGDENYQYWRWLGIHGKSEVSANQMGSSVNPNVIVHMWAAQNAEAAMLAGWPGAARSVLAAPESGHDPETWARQDVWYQSNSLGYAIMKWLRHGLPTASDHLMLSYAWKRYSQPDATIHGFVGSTFKTDEVGAHTISIAPGTALTVAPYGRPETRDLECVGAQEPMVSASINWGDGTSTTVPLEQLNSGSFNHTYASNGFRYVTLSVVDHPCSGTGDNVTTNAAIPVLVAPPGGGGCTKNCPTENSPTPPSDVSVVDLSPGIRGIHPNPFLASATIHFTVPDRVTPELEVFDVRGHRIRNERLAEHPAGAWHWSWDGRDGAGRRVAAGVYFVRLALGSHVESRRVVNMRP